MFPHVVDNEKGPDGLEPTHADACSGQIAWACFTTCVAEGWGGTYPHMIVHTCGNCRKIPCWCRGGRGPRSGCHGSHGAGGREEDQGASSDGRQKLGELEKLGEIHVSCAITNV
jgi:hypothetical protein